MTYCESTLRRKAYKIGYQVVKGFQHYGPYVYHNSYGERYTGYMVRDLSNGFYEWGSYNSNLDFCWDIEDVEEFLKDRYEELGLVW